MSGARMKCLAAIATVQGATLELKLGAFARALERRYSPDQLRVPAGTPEGGRWTATGESPSARTRTALAGVLIDQRVGVGDGELIRMCTYQDMFGRLRSREIDAGKLCPPVLKFPAYYGPF